MKGVTRGASAWPCATPPGGALHAASRLQADPAHGDAETQEYVDLLDRVLEDRVVTEAEVEGLFETATRWGLSRDRVLSIHQSYLEALVRAAVADGVLTPAERDDLQLVARLFGYGTDTLDVMVRAARSRGPATPLVDKPAPARKSLAGLSVCFTGESRLTFQGEHLTRAKAEELAARAGLIVKKTVTRDLDLLVVVDAHSLSGKAITARRYGTWIVAEKVFWDMLSVPMS